MMYMQEGFYKQLRNVKKNGHHFRAQGIINEKEVPQASFLFTKLLAAQQLKIFTMGKRIKKRYDIDVTGANAIHSKTFELDKNVEKVHGILLASDRDDLMYYRGSNKVEINSDEIFPEGYETKLLMSGLNVSPNDRFYNLGGVPPGNFKV